METLKGTKVFLRAIEPSDVEAIYRIENDERLWGVSETKTPFSLQVIKDYVANAHLDIYEVKQLRLVICELDSGKLLGLVDLFDFDAYNLRAGVGILIEKEASRGKGYGAESLNLLMQYAKQHLGLHQLYANIGEDNLPSVALFEKQGFIKVGVKKEWRRTGATYKDEFLYQYIL